jgi:hypothetical protein
MQQQSHEGMGASVNIAVLNQAYQESRNWSTVKGKEAADQTVFACQDQLRQQHIKFHLAPRGEWGLDSRKEVQHESL